MAGAALSQGQVQISWQAQDFRKVRYRFCGSRSTFARSGTDFMAAAALSQGRSTFASAHRREPAPTGANRRQPVRTGANRCEPVRTGANRCEPVRMGVNRCEPVRTGAIRCEPLRMELRTRLPPQCNIISIISYKYGKSGYMKIKHNHNEALKRIQRWHCRR